MRPLAKVAPPTSKKTSFAERLIPNVVVRRYNGAETKNGYRRIISDFCLWLYDHDDEFVLSDSLRAEFARIDGIPAAAGTSTAAHKRSRDKAMRDLAYRWIEADEKLDAGSDAQRGLFDLDKYKTKPVIDYICSRTQIVRNKRTGQQEEKLLGKSWYGSIRTALTNHVTKVYQHEWSQRDRQKISDTVKGIGNELADKTQNQGAGKMEPAKGRCRLSCTKRRTCGLSRDRKKLNLK